MADQREGKSGRAGARYDRHDEAFWRDLLAQWRNSGGNIRAFCRQHGLAVSTFGLWRKRLSQEQPLPVAPPMAVTADTAFIAATTVAVPNVLPTSDSALSRSRDQVVVTLGGARIEMAGVHAERIVRFVLGQLGGGRC
ncbi:hypothetical protein CF70_034535 [Cupriavidus sp. SK-3]|uniref:IS66 family insertion sequence element accessory protein TnpA n=1 Tax=Cupriavidus sp. SK-3 TaxID=1470558 RepID=UPI000452C4E1|nr:hypothetical protein [Cupriavidus sp. SK-3]KDP87766.1 hypothetical protein CF70_034535 [Cupriavidus sp. SK-3]